MEEANKPNHKGHEVISYNEMLIRNGEEPSKGNEGILWCVDCEEEITPLD